MKIKKATARYEEWLGEQITIVERDLELKHRLMAEELFPFMRATYYRWAQVFPEACETIADAPEVLAIGDLHVENFGTWRDAEGRLVWGINDFDEAYPLPYTHDLVRLAASAHLATRAAHLSLKLEDACEALLKGYRESLEAGGGPLILAERHAWLRELATSGLRDPERFWQKLDGLDACEEAPPKSAVAAIERLLPESNLELRWVHRVAGLGSLGRQRWVALAEWRGGRIAREAKAEAASGAAFARGKSGGRIYYDDVLEQSVRAIDPLITVRDGWCIRRLSPDCSRIELSDLPKSRDETRLLHAMGWETANIHLGTKGGAKAIRKHLQKLDGAWLKEGARTMTHELEADWHAWRDAHKGERSREPAAHAAS